MEDAGVLQALELADADVERVALEDPRGRRGRRVGGGAGARDAEQPGGDVDEGDFVSVFGEGEGVAA